MTKAINYMNWFGNGFVWWREDDTAVIHNHGEVRYDVGDAKRYLLPTIEQDPNRLKPIKIVVQRKTIGST